MSDDLVQFLRDRLGEDHEAARLVLGVNVMADVKRGKPVPRWVPSPEGDAGIWDTSGTPRVRFVWARERDHIVRHDPARVLAEVDAKRRIVASYESAATAHRVATEGTEVHELMTGSVNSLRYVLRLLALPYSDHPAYRPEWRP